MASIISWGILGTGFIASRFAESVQQSPLGRLQSVASRTEAGARQFAEKYTIPSHYANYDELLQDKSIDAVYISTPHPFHREWAERSLKAGKPTLCEKPIGMNLREARELFAIAEEQSVLLMEAYMYRCHPQITKAIELMKSGIIGELQAMEAHFCFAAPFDPKARLFNRDLGGGAILDVGGYPLSFCRLFAGLSLGQDFANPCSIKAHATLNPQTGCDEHASALLEFPGNIHANISCASRFSRPEVATLYGSLGSLTINSPWLPPEGSPTFLTLSLQDQPPQRIQVDNPRLVWSYEVDQFAKTFDDPRQVHPAMSPEDSLGNMDVMDKWMQLTHCAYN